MNVAQAGSLNKHIGGRESPSKVTSSQDSAYKNLAMDAEA
jgi:hypothetical protein